LYFHAANGGVTPSCGPGRMTVPNGEVTPSSRPDQRSQSFVGAVCSFCASPGSSTHNSSSIAFSEKNRRFAVPRPGWTFEGLSINPHRVSHSASAAPRERQINRWSSFHRHFLSLSDGLHITIVQMRFRNLLLVMLVVPVFAQDRHFPCANCAAWNTPQPAFRIYGNTYYVGPHGLSSILITSEGGNILIDSALPESAPLIVANIRTLGFRIEDVKLIVNSHAHFDHAGGIAELQRLSGARVAASEWTADVMKKGAVPRDDPQFGTIDAIARVARVETFKDGQTLSAGGVTLTAHLTPGHTPGGTAWTWRSCENGRCLNLVYADSLTPVSADGFLFSRRKAYPHADDFERSFSFLGSTPCDILVTPHPEASNLWPRLEQHDVQAHALVDPTACRVLAETSRGQLRNRLAKENVR
jgi:metallo-beta-lactamase class B